MELSIGHVKPATLELNVKRGERLHSDQVMDDAGGIAVVLAVMEGLDGTSGILKVLVPKNKGKFPTFNSKQRMTNQNSYNKTDEKKAKVIPNRSLLVSDFVDAFWILDAHGPGSKNEHL